MSDALISYAALILADAELEVSASNLQSLVSAAGASVDNIWTEVYAKALEGKNLKELLFSMAAAAPSSGAGAASAGASGASADAAAEEEVEEEKEESDDDMGFGLFD